MTALESEEQDYDLSQYEGWKAMADRSPRKKPPTVTQGDLAVMPKLQRDRYNDARTVWHANMGPFLTPQMKEVLDEIDLLVQANRQDGDKVRSSSVLDAYPGLGKTTLAIHYGKNFHRQQIELHGPTTSGGHDRIPVAFASLTGKTTMRSLNSTLCRFYGHPSFDRGNATQLGVRASASALATATRLIIIDDVHFLNPNSSDGREVANHFKWLANEFPTTFLFIGVGLEERGLFTEGLGPSRVQYAQTARRWTRSTLTPLRIDDHDSRATWNHLLKAIERDLVLVNKTQGMIADDLADYLYARSTGHFASLMTLITRGCRKAISTGVERLTVPLMETVKNDAASEAARRYLEASFSHGTLTTRGLPR